MKKNGFTLAEVLVTLGVIGVVAALTLPGLMQDTSNAQIGPKLAKAVSVFEQANESLLNDNSVDSLTDGRIVKSTSTRDYADNFLSRYIKITKTSVTNTYMSKDGMSYEIKITDMAPDNTTDPAYMQRIGDIKIDLNGPNNQPNVDGADVFYFSFWNDGSLRPKGGIGWNGLANSDYGGSEHWATKCTKTKSSPDLSYCAGSIFENNLKVNY